MSDDITRNYHRGDPNSEDAFNAVPGKKRARDRYRILGWIRDHGPATCEQVEDGVGLSHQTCSARISELRRSAHLVEVGRGRTRSGRSARIHGLADT
jgi:hypothetical protein